MYGLSQSVGDPGVVGGDVSPTIIHQINPDPSVHIAGAFVVPNQQPVESDWSAILIGAVVIMGLAVMLTRSNR